MALVVASPAVVAVEVVAVAGSLASYPRHTARGIVVHQGNILLMERWRPGLHYFSIPGGGIEPGETPEATVVRELREETSVEVKVGRPVLEMRVGDLSHLLYLCEYISGEPHLPDDAPEAQLDAAINRFKPRWVDIGLLDELPFIYWEPIRLQLIEGMQHGFDDKVKIVSVPPAR